MNEDRLYVDFNEMLEENLAMLSQKDSKEDSSGNIIYINEGLKIKIYMDDENEFGQKDNLLAEGIVEKNNYTLCPHVKWNCRIDENGIYNESKKLC